MATSRPPSETSWTVVDLAFADQRADEAAGLDLVGEIDRRRRALELAGGLLLVERLAEVARSRPMTIEQVALALQRCRPCATRRG